MGQKVVRPGEPGLPSITRNKSIWLYNGGDQNQFKRKESACAGSKENKAFVSGRRRKFSRKSGFVEAEGTRYPQSRKERRTSKGIFGRPVTRIDLALD